MRNLIEFVKKMLKLKNPCKKCLVVAACKQEQDCAAYREYIRNKKYIEDELTTAAAIFTIFMAVLGILFVCFMFILGFWKVLEIV